MGNIEFKDEKRERMSRLLGFSSMERSQTEVVYKGQSVGFLERFRDHQRADWIPTILLLGYPRPRPSEISHLPAWLQNKHCRKWRTLEGAKSELSKENRVT